MAMVNHLKAVFNYCSPDPISYPVQINPNQNLPAISHLRPEPVSRESRPRQPQPISGREIAPDRRSESNGNQANRRPPLFMQPMSGASYSRMGEQAMRTYHDVAMAGGREELVNRINETV